MEVFRSIIGCFNNKRRNCLIIVAGLVFAFLIISNIDSRYFASHAISNEVLTFSHESGSYDNSFELSISDANGGKIYYTLDGSLPAVGKSGTYEYNTPIAVNNLKGTEPVLTTRENGSKFTDSIVSNAAYTPDKEVLDRATIVRAIAVYEDGTFSPVSTRTFFVGNDITTKYKDCAVMSIVTDPDNLIDGTKGIYVRGDKYDNGEYDSTIENPFEELVNYMQSGKKSERAAYMDFFDGGHKYADVSRGVGIRIHGGYSRRFIQKSFNIYFRDEYDYGTKNLKGYDLIPGATKTYYDKSLEGATDKTMKYANVMLRNGGNDWDATKIQDLFIQSMVTDKNFTTQAVRPCILYLNGEFWGLYNLTEKYSDKYIGEEFAVDNNNVIVYKDLQIDEGEALDPDGAALQELLDLGKLDMTIEENYRKFQDIVDIDSYVDYMATEVYINNNDWWSGTNPEKPNNNLQFWKVADPSKEDPDNPYADGKWRYMLFDTEWSMGIYGNRQAGWDYDSIKYHAIGEPDPNLSSDANRDVNNGDPVFAALIKNDDFRKRFTTALLDLRNWNYEYNRCSDALDKISDVYGPLMDYNYERWGNSFSSYRVEELKNFLNNRAGYVFEMLENNIPVLSESGRVNVNVSSNIYTKDCIKVNSVMPDTSKGWNAVYYNNYPVEVTAAEVDGYTFDHWEVSGGTAANPDAASTEIILGSNSTSIKAIYTYADGEPVPTPTATPIPTATPSPTPVPAQPEVTTSNVNSGYIVEYAVPFNTAKQAGDKIGFEVQVNDCTSDGLRYGTLNLFATGSPYNSGEEFGTIVLSDSASSTGIEYDRTINAAKAGEKVIIDGYIDSAWDKAKSIRLNNYQVDKGERHCNAVARFLWDENNIYVLVIVEDDDMCTNTNTYQSDSVEIFYDEDAGNTEYYQEDMFQHRILYSGTKEFGKYNNDSIPDMYDVKAAARLNGYYAEFAIPFKNAKQAGDKVSFELQVINSISSYTSGRVSKLNLFAKDSAFSDRRNFGTLQLCGAYSTEDVMISETSAYALKTDSSIKADGMIESAWFNAKAMDMTIYTPKTINEVPYPQDISATARVLWDDNYLYALVIVDDGDICKFASPTECDSVEVFFDEDVSVNESSSSEYTPTAFQFRAYSDGQLKADKNYENAGYEVEAAASSVGSSYKALEIIPEPTPEPTATPEPVPTVEPTTSPEPSAAPTDIPEECGYKLTFVTEPGVSITTYKTQDYSDVNGIAYNQTQAVARNSMTGKVDISGSGQCNFTVVAQDGYEVVDVSVEPTGNYKNIKGKADTGLDNTYRITKISGDVTVTIQTQKKNDNPIDKYTVQFVTDEHVSITTYATKNYDDESGIAYNQTEAIVRNGDTGEVDISGAGQVNFTIVPDEGYEVKDLDVSPRYSYNNKKNPDETLKENTYRITQISGNLTITIESAAVGEGTETPESTATPAATSEPTSTVEPLDTPEPAATEEPMVETTAGPTVTPEVTEEPAASPTRVPEGQAGKLILNKATIWDRLLNIITFGQYELPEPTVEIISNIENSTVEYIVITDGSTRVMTSDELTKVDNWSEYEEEIKLLSEENVVYARITDKDNGYIYYLCTDGITVKDLATPTVKPADEPTARPTVKPVDEPTAGPTDKPADELTASPTDKPADKPTVTTTPTVKPAGESTANSADNNEELSKPGNVSGIKLKAGRKKINVKWKKMTDATGYRIKYSLKKNFKGSKTLTVKANKSSCILKKLKSKRYYIKMCAYNAAGTGKWSKVYKIKVK